MKKVLFATTALVATAGYASADITLTGVAQMGLQGGSGQETQFVQDIDVTFTMSGSTDNGLTFGAAVDLDENAANVGTDDAGVAIFISGDFGTLTMGDTDGALDWALTEAWVGNAGSINDNETGHAGALGAYGDGAYDGQILRYNYAVGDFGFAISVEQDGTGLRDDGFAIGFRYGLDLGGADVDLGLGYQTLTAGPAGFTPGNLSAVILGGPLFAAGTEIDIIGFSAAVELDSGLSAGLQYTQWDTAAGDADHIALGAGYTFDAFTVSANWGRYDATGFDVSGFGLAAAYDLGGGLSMHLGYGSSDYNAPVVADVDTWSLGLSMSF